MPRTCFVIMPFSGTGSCTKEEWTRVFEELFKPAIEAAGLDYECRRSEANRGNIVAGIVRDLDGAYVVLADLTDHNANVFYELGVRHALRNRTIIVAQRREDLPFDLRNYASHVYDWKSEDGRRQFADKVRELLLEVDTSPERADNPVSDFLQGTPQARTTHTNSRVPEDAHVARPLVGPGSEGVDVIALARSLSRRGPARAAKEIYRRTQPELLRQFGSAVDQLNQRAAPGRVNTNKIQTVAQEFIAEGEPLVVSIEQFALTAVDEDWKEGVSVCISFAGDLISLSETPRPGQSFRFATGLPALLAWRFLVLMGARALAESSFELLSLIIRHPIEVEKRGTFEHRSLLDRGNLFYAESFLGYADYSALYLSDLWERQPHLHEFFPSSDEFHFQVAQFLMVAALASAAKDDDFHLLYPGYKLFPQASRAMSALCGRLASIASYREALAGIIVNGNGEVLKGKWKSMASRLNSLELGSRYGLHWSPAFPEEI